jgi:hypothetical protein
MTCKMSQRDQQTDQQELLPMSKSAPITHLLLDEWLSERFSGFGPLKNAIAMAPPTQTAVPRTLAMLLISLIFTLSCLSMNWMEETLMSAMQYFRISPEKLNYHRVAVFYKISCFSVSHQFFFRLENTGRKTQNYCARGIFS